MPAVSAKFKAMLRARHASNKRRKWHGCCIRLNYQEVAVVQSQEPSHLFVAAIDAGTRCPTCGPKKGLCKVRACAAARRPLLLGYNPAVGAQDGA